MTFGVKFSVIVGDDMKIMTPKHQIWCNFNTKFGIIVGDAPSGKRLLYICSPYI